MKKPNKKPIPIPIWRLLRKYSIIAAMALVAVITTAGAAQPTREEILAANEWCRQQAREYTQRIVGKKPMGMRLEAYAQFCAEDHLFPNDPAKQKWFVAYAVPLTEAVMAYCEQTILKTHYELDSSNVFLFYVTLKDYPQDIEKLAKLLDEEGLIPATPEPEVRKAIAIKPSPRPTIARE